MSDAYRSPLAPDANEGLVALVTGGGTGLGRAIAREYARTGARVVIAGRRAEPLEEVASELMTAGAQVLSVSGTDVREPDNVASLVETVLDRFGTIDVLVNNAGVTVNTPLFEIDEQGFDDVLAVNLRGVFFGCQLVGPIMREQGWGRIVNLTSLAGQQGGLVAGAHYAASKAGIIVLTKIFARELAGDGVTVNGFTANPPPPAAIDGPIMQALPQARVAQFAEAIPVGRVGRPEEVAALVAFLCGEDAGYITGATMDINGGLAMR
jgi:3-oxoacyl-[acyl-carrier protein] reductase